MVILRWLGRSFRVGIFFGRITGLGFAFRRECEGQLYLTMIAIGLTFFAVAAFMAYRYMLFGLSFEARAGQIAVG